MAIHLRVSMLSLALAACSTSASSPPDDGTNDASATDASPVPGGQDGGTDDATVSDAGPPVSSADAGLDATADAADTGSPHDAGAGTEAGDAAGPTSKWSWINPVGSGDTFRSLFPLATNDIWAVGDCGAVAHFDGTSWTSVNLNTSAFLTGVWASSPGDVWVSGNGAIFHWNGVAWEVSYATDAYVSDIHGTGPSDVWAVGSHGSSDLNNVFHWDGTSWTASVQAAGNSFRGVWTGSAAAVPRVWVVGDNTNYGTGEPSSIALDGGTWTPVTYESGNLSATHIWGADPSHVYFAGTSGLVMWDGTNLAPTGSFAAVTAISGSSPSDMWATALTNKTNQVTYPLHFDGATWSIEFADPQISPEAYADIGPTDTWAIGGSNFQHWNGSMWAENAFGRSAGQLFADTENTGLWAGASDDVWAANDTTASMNHWNGTSWSVFPSPAAGYGSLWGATSNDIWAGGYGVNSIAHWDGASWSSVDTGLITEADSIVGSSASNVWFAQETDSDYVVRWDGVSWNPVISPGKLPLLLWTSGPTDTWAIASADAPVPGETLYHWDGVSWTVVPYPGDVSDRVRGRAPNDLWMIDQDEQLSHWDGKSWTVQNVTFPEFSQFFTVTPSGTVYINGEHTVYSWNGVTLNPEIVVTPYLRSITSTPLGEVWLTADNSSVLRRAL